MFKSAHTALRFAYAPRWHKKCTYIGRIADGTPRAEHYNSASGDFETYAQAGLLKRHIESCTTLSEQSLAAAQYGHTVAYAEHLTAYVAADTGLDAQLVQDLLAYLLHNPARQITLRHHIYPRHALSYPTLCRRCHEVKRTLATLNDSLLMKVDTELLNSNLIQSVA